MRLKKTGALIMWVVIGVILMGNCSCSLTFKTAEQRQEKKAQKHVRKANRHIIKAKELDPNAFRYDTVRTKYGFYFDIKLDTNYMQHLKPRVLYQIDSSFKKEPLSESQTKIVYKIIKEEVEKCPEAVAADTTFNFPDGSSVRVQFKKGKLIGEQVTACVQETAILKESFWQTWAGGVTKVALIIAGIFLVLRFVLRVI